MLSEREISTAVGGPAYGADGSKLGTIEAFFADDRTGAPTWVAVSTGLFGTRHSIAPVAEATFSDGALQLPVTSDAVKSAPPMAGDHLDPADEETLRRHYGLADTAPAMDTAPPVPPMDARTSADTVPPVSSPLPADATRAIDTTSPVLPPVTPGPRHADREDTARAAGTDGAMTRSEEQLRVGTERVAATRARLVKYVVTEDVQITVPIRREEIRVEQVPIDEPADSDVRGGEALVTDPAPTSGGLPDEIILHTERPVVSVEVVPVERVRLRTELVEGQETVTEQVQRERIVVDQDRLPGVNPR
jgi:stress response protein YsnF